MRKALPLCIVFACVLTTGVLAQEEIELLHADKFTVDNRTPEGASKLRGNVRLKHQNALMYCDSALLFDDNNLEAFGHVKIRESDSLTVTGDSLFYNGNTRIAKVRGRVTVDNRSSVLQTRHLDYDRKTGSVHYFAGGVIDSKKEKLHLTSSQGYYYSGKKLFHFKQNVVMEHPDYTIYTDTMHYSTDKEKAWFFGPTRIVSEDRNIYCERGWYDQLQDVAQFIRNARILSSGQIMKGDTIQYDERKKIGISRSNVVLIDTNERFEVNGDYAIYYELDSVSYVTKNMMMKQDMDGDTFFLMADTLHSFMDSTHHRVVKTYHDTRFYKSDMQGRCDSLVYLTKDSVIFMYKDPILWTDDNQMVSDSVRITLSKGTVQNLYMDRNAFIISKEDSNLYNQIKGRKMIGYFKDARLSKVSVIGNGQTVYYPREDDNTLIGVNETKCSNMLISLDSNKIRKITFYDRPTAKLTPTDEMPAEGLKLDWFVWRESERPRSMRDLYVMKKVKPSAPAGNKKAPRAGAATKK